MDIKKTTNGTHTEFALSGRLDTNTAPDLDDAIVAVVDDTDELVLDFKELTFVSSAGLRVLVRALDAMEDKGGTLTLRNVCDNILEVFEVTGLEDMLTIE